MMKADRRLLHHVERIGFETVVTSAVVAEAIEQRRLQPAEADDGRR